MAVFPALEQPRRPVHGKPSDRVEVSDGPFQRGYPKETLRQDASLREVEDGSVESNEDWYLDQRGDASGERIHALLLVELGDLFVQSFRVILEFVLQLLDFRLKILNMDC